MTEQEIAQLRERINAVDDEFSRKANILLDNQIQTEELLKQLEQRVDSYIEQSREYIQQSREQTGLIQMRLDLDRQRIIDSEERFNRFVLQAEADRQAFQNEIRRIWEYLLSQHPNGSSGSP